MKTQIKLAFLICTTVLTHALSAQTHKKAASNCIMYDDYVKAARKTKNAVSCVDCYCKICGDKKQKEKEAKLKQAEAANKQKTTTPQKKTTAKTTTKTKRDEAILVAPKPKVSTAEVTETAQIKKNAEPQKELKTISKKVKTVDKEKIEMLLNEISKVYKANRNFEDIYGFYTFDFSGTKITIKNIKEIRSYKYEVYIYSFDLVDLIYLERTPSQAVSFDAKNTVCETGTWLRRKGSAFEGEMVNIVNIDKPNFRSLNITNTWDDFKNPYNDNQKVFELLKQAALEAGATFQEKTEN